MRGPDVVPPVSTMGEIESRMGLPPLEALLAERDTLVKQVAILRATHGPFGTYEALRKMQLASIGAILRAKAVEAGVRITEAAIYEGSPSHRDYLNFVTRATRGKAGGVVAGDRISGGKETVPPGAVIGGCTSPENGRT